MTGSREHEDYLRDILEASENIANFLSGCTYETFEKDIKTSYAVIRALEVIGEASKKIPASIKEANADVPWREMSGIRDKLIHDYFGINLGVVWKTAIEDIPKLQSLIAQIVNDLNTKTL